MSLGDASLLKTEQARLVAAEGNTQVAETMAADSARTANSPNYSMIALDLLAQLQLRQHKSAEARATLAQVNDKLKLISTDKEAATRVQLLQARLDTDAGDIAAAQAILHQLQQAANALKDKDLLLRVQLAYGEAEERAGRGNITLQTAVKDSRRSGFLLIADSVSAPPLL